MKCSFKNFTKCQWLVFAAAVLAVILILMLQIFGVFGGGNTQKETPAGSADAVTASPAPVDTASPSPSPSPAPTPRPAVDLSAVAGLSRNGKQWSYGYYKKVSDGNGGRVTERDDHGVEQLYYELETADAALVQKYGGVTGHSDKKTVYLTFDEGYENGYSGKILDTLKEKGVHAIFFVTGEFVESNPDLVRRMHAEGHLIGNHTENHVKMPDQSDEKFMAELNNLEKRVQALLGDDYLISYYRPPEGWLCERDMALAQQMGYKATFWSFAYGDYFDVDNGTPEHLDYAYRRITQSLHDGEVFLLHACSRANAELLGDVIDFIRGQGYTIDRIDQM